MRYRVQPRRSSRRRRSPATRAAAIAIVLLALLPDPADAARAGPAASTDGARAGSDQARWVWPVTGAIVGPFAAPPTRYSAGHRGIDIRVPAGVAVRAPASGVVHFAGWVVDRPVLSIAHADGVLSSFEPVEASVATGDVVGAGEVIGALIESDASHCAPSCLHLGARVNGEYVNPLLFLGGLPWSVLLPID